MNDLSLMVDDILPSFRHFDPKKIVEDIEIVLITNIKKINELLLNNGGNPDETLIASIEALNIPLTPLLDMMIHFRDVSPSSNLDKFLNKALIKILEYNANIMHNKNFHEIYTKFSNKLDQIQNIELKKILMKNMNNFRLSGYTLNDGEKRKLSTIMKRLTELAGLFESNIETSLDKWLFNTVDRNLLQGIPDTIVQDMQEAASQLGLSGYVIRLNHLHYSTILKYADSTHLRQKIYMARHAIATEEDCNKACDNTAVLSEIILLRSKIAKILGFKNYAEYTLSDRCLKNTQQIFDFLSDLTNSFRERATKEINELKGFGKDCFNLEEIHAWDIEYLSQKLLLEKYKFSMKDLQISLSEKKVLQCLFHLSKSLFNIEISETECKDTWHQDVRLFNVYDHHNILLGRFYLDIYYRKNKRQGAWCAELKPRCKINNFEQIPIACIIANFNKVKIKHETHIFHQDMVTLFHEFGHCLHKILTKVNFPMIGGDSGIQLDATEFVSQFMETWAWNEEILTNLLQKTIFEHEVEHTIAKLKMMKNFQAGIRMIQNIELSLLDMILHTNPLTDYWLNDKLNVTKLSTELSLEMGIFPFEYPARTAHTFLHIFSRCFPAGYYSYLFSEVLAIDAYYTFKESKNLDYTGHKFRTTILEQGALEDPIVLFSKFKGKSFSIHAMLKYYDVESNQSTDKLDSPLINTSQFFQTNCLVSTVQEV